MILIAESGSTKTDWVLIDDSRIESKFATEGLNPVYKNDSEIRSVIINSLKLDYSKLTEVHFFGAGCMGFEKGELLKITLESIFTNATIVVNSDILGAALSIFNQNSGIAVILGTGANVCIYDGEEIVETRSGLGYILGDEGSGAHIGKRFIQDYLNGFIPDECMEIITKELSLEKKDIISSVYRSSSPNLFFAQFSKFISTYIHLPYFHDLVKSTFVELFENHITKIEQYQNYKIGFVGSVSYFFQDILTEVCDEYSIKIEKIIQKPIKELVKYYSIS